MTVLVTGGAGNIGSHLVWELLDAGEEVVVLDRLSTGFEWAVAPEARLVVADPLAYYDNNTAKTRTLIETAVKSGVEHFIFSSTAAVYGAAGMEPVREDAVLSPESPYGRSKLMSEWMLADTAAAHNMRYTALRYFNVAGADPKGRTGQSTVGATHLIKVASETALGKRPSIKVFGTDYPTPDGTCIRDYIHVSDLAAAHHLALKRLRDGGESLVANCGYSLAEAKVIIEAWRPYYNTERPHSSLGYKPPAPAAILWPAPPRGSTPPSAQAMAERPVMH